MHDYQVPGLEVKPEIVKTEGDVNMVFPAVGIAFKIRATIMISLTELDDYDSEVAAISGREDMLLDASSIKDFLISVAIYGFNLNSSPSANHAIALLNIASFLRKETIEADFLAGLALMNQRRIVQAAEFIRRAEDALLEDLDTLPV
jgi:hypothetical protein